MTAIILFLSGIVYLLADRYLIEHVEITDVSAYASSQPQVSTVQLVETEDNELGSINVPDLVATQPVTVDDWNYSSKSLTISIKQVTRGTGSDTNEGVWNTLSFGPALLEGGIIPQNLEQVEVDTNFGNHSIQGSHPRTGIGIIKANHFIFVVVDGRSRGYSRGLTITEFAEVFQQLGASVAYNLDGGGSSTMYFMGRVVNNPHGREKERGISDILYVN